MHENLMDMNHQFLHRRQMGKIARAFARAASRRKLGRGRLYVFRARAGQQPIGEALVFGQSRQGTKQAHKDVMTIRTNYPYQTLQIRTADASLVMDLWIV